MLARSGHCVRQGRILVATSRLGMNVTDLAPLIREIQGTEATAGTSSEELRFIARSFWLNRLSVPQERLLLAMVRESGARAKLPICAQTPLTP